MGFGTPAVVLEGDYTTWTKKWTVDFPDEGILNVDHEAMGFSDSYLYIIWRAKYGLEQRWRLMILNLADGSTKFSSPSDVYYTSTYPDLSYSEVFECNQLAGTRYGAAGFSLLGRYILLLRYGDTQFEIWKDGEKVWTSPLASEAVAGASTYYFAGLRRDGKYVIAVTDNTKIVCFQGS
jgi:hypothetical protein